MPESKEDRAALAFRVYMHTNKKLRRGSIDEQEIARAAFIEGWRQNTTAAVMRCATEVARAVVVDAFTENTK